MIYKLLLLNDTLMYMEEGARDDVDSLAHLFTKYCN